MDLFAQQARNRRMTWLLMGGFGLLLLAVGYAIDPGMAMSYPIQIGSTAMPLPLAPVGAVGVSALMAVFTYYQGDKVILASMRARSLDESRLPERQFRNVCEEMAIAAGLPMPRLYVVPDEDLNAFATGRSPEHAAVAVTEGLLAALDREELQAVVAHELGHVKNLDIRLMMIVSVMLGAIALLGDMALRSGRSRRLSREKGGANPLLLIVAIIAPLIARMLAMAVSRTREFDADRSAAEFTRNPLALARALAKLEAAQAPTRYATQGTAHLFVVDPRLSSLNEREDWLGNLFATHPPIKQRIARLEKMGYGELEAAS